MKYCSAAETAHLHYILYDKTATYAFDLRYFTVMHGNVKNAFKTCMNMNINESK